MEKPRLIPLTGKNVNGRCAIVDAEDYESLMKYNWQLTSFGYARSRGVIMHRQLTNAPKGMDVDHINHNRLDNRKSNLRICTRSENCHNMKKMVKGTSKYKGVYWSKKRKTWEANLRFMDKTHWIGYFDTEIKAAKAYDKTANKMFGEFAATNKTLGLYGNN